MMSAIGIQQGLGLFAGIMLVAAGVRMIAQPSLYLGPRWFDAHDPRTVRQFGAASLVFGSAILILTLIKLLAE
jgi:hypothetical protein